MKRKASPPAAGRNDDALIEAAESGVAGADVHLAIAQIEFAAGNFNAAGLRAHAALKAAPGDAQAMAMLARASFELRDFQNAATAALNAFAGGVDDPALRYVLAVALTRLGATLTDAGGVVRQPAELMADARRRAPALARRYDAALQNPGPDYDAVTEAALLRALQLGAQPVEEYYPVIDAVAARDAGWRRLLDLAAAGLALDDPDMPGFAAADIAVLARQRPLLHFWRSRCNIDLRIELLLTAARRFILMQVVAARPLPRPAAELAEVLAWQCHLNEHVFHESPDEARQIARLEATLQAGSPLQSAELICLASYRDLEILAGIDRLDRSRLSAAALDILALSVDEAADRRRRAAAIETGTAIDDAVSREVRDFYEATPYPRWRMLRRHLPAPRPYREVMAGAIPHMRPLDARGDDGLDVLVAGCGTGKALDAPRRYRGARITALDLSLASLAYAWQRHDDADIRYLHGDILRVRDMGLTFDAIECTGVVHHLDDPWAGVGALADILRPDGTMLLAVYSPAFRQLLAPAMTAAAKAAQATLGPLRTRIGAARRHVLTYRHDGPAMAVATTMVDFFSTSEFRDLLLHPVERPLSLRELVAGAARFGLEPIGLMPTNAHLRILAETGPAPAGIDEQIAAWSALEQSQPELFLTMLAVLFRKRSPAPIDR